MNWETWVSYIIINLWLVNKLYDGSRIQLFGNWYNICILFFELCIFDRKNMKIIDLLGEVIYNNDQDRKYYNTV